MSWIKKMKAPYNKAIRRKPTKEDIELSKKNPYDERLPVPRHVGEGEVYPGYRKVGAPGMHLGDFFTKYSEEHGEDFYSHFDDGEPRPALRKGMSQTEQQAVLDVYERKRKEKPGMFGNTEEKGFFRRVIGFWG